MFVGQDIPRVDGVEKVTGQAVYGVDLKMSGMLYGKVLRSPFPHARVVHIDASKAARLVGVKAIVTGKEFPQQPYGTDIKDSYFLAVDKVRYQGEPVAVVAATSEELAAEAASLIEVEYEELDAVFAPLRAMEPDAPLVHQDLASYHHGPSVNPISGTNICNHFRLLHGDIEQGFNDADLVLENSYRFHKAQHCHMEPHAALARAEASGRITIWACTQAPYRQRAELAECLGIPFNKVRVIASRCGGGFGAKGSLKLEPLVALLSLKSNYRPVKMTMTREEEFMASVARHPALVEMKTGVKKDGRLTASRVRMIWDTGAYSEKGEVVSRNAGYSAGGPYQIPHVQVDSYCVYTNTLTCGAFRGFGMPQVSWALEQQIDVLAEELNIDPVQMRQINGAEDGSVSATGEVLRSVGFKDTLNKASRAIAWQEKPSGSYRGKGIASCHKNTATGTSSSAFVKVDEDGTVSVMTSACEIGQGSNTILAQMVAEELGLPLEAVTLVDPDTDITPFDFGTVSSRITFFTGNAVLIAVEEAKERLLELAAQKLEANPKDLRMAEGRVYVEGSPQRGLSLKEIFEPSRRHGLRRGYVLGRGSYTPAGDVLPDPETGQSPRPTAFWMYATHAAEVEVDPETGEVKLTKVTAAHDVGRAINPASCNGQIQGSLGFGIFAALAEELVTHQGKVINPSFLDYQIPTSLDLPEMVIDLVEVAHPDGPYGAKGLADAAVAPTAPAIANAIFNATGIRIYDTPISSEKVFLALREKGRRH